MELWVKQSIFGRLEYKNVRDLVVLPHCLDSTEPGTALTTVQVTLTDAYRPAFANFFHLGVVSSKKSIRSPSKFIPAHAAMKEKCGAIVSTLTMARKH